MWREPVGGGDKPVALNHINLLKVSDTSYHNIQKLHSLLTSQMFHEQGPKQAIYLINSCAQWFEVLQAFSIESYGTAGVHARERHFSGMFTMKGLEREQSERVVIRKVLFTFRQNISIKRSTVTIQLVYFMFSHYSGDSQRGVPGATSVVACDCKFPSAKLTKIDCSGVWIQKLFWYPPLMTNSVKITFSGRNPNEHIWNITAIADDGVGSHWFTTWLSPAVTGGYKTESKKKKRRQYFLIPPRESSPLLHPLWADSSEGPSIADGHLFAQQGQRRKK